MVLLKDEHGHEGTEGVHLLARAYEAVKAIRVPAEAAGAVGITGLGHALSRRLEDGEEGLAEEGGHLDGLGKPTVEVAFEGQHVGGTLDPVDELAGNFDGGTGVKEHIDGGFGQLGEVVGPLGFTISLS